MNRNSFGAYDNSMLSDEGDLYSDDDDTGSGFVSESIRGGNVGDKIIPSAADRRAHHNALERKRRDHIKDSFSGLRDSVPSLQGEKVTASRAQILKKAAEYIQFMRKKNTSVQDDIDNIAKQNKMLEEQIRRLESGQSSSGSGSSINNSSLSSLFAATETVEAATSYDISENSNTSSNSMGSNSLVVPGGSSVISNGSVASSSGNTSSVHSIMNGLDEINNGSIINGTVHVRPVTIGKANSTNNVTTTTSKIIVQNPQHKNVPHVIHVTTAAGSGISSNTNGSSGGNITAMTSNGTPIIISSLSSNGNGASATATTTNNGYVVKGNGAISLANGFRTLVVHPAGGNSSGANQSTSSMTKTPNIQILGTIPGANYSKQMTKKLKISAHDADSIISNTTATNGRNSTTTTTNSTTNSNVTSVSS